MKPKHHVMRVTKQRTGSEANWNWNPPNDPLFLQIINLYFILFLGNFVIICHKYDTNIHQNMITNIACIIFRRGFSAMLNCDC